MSDPLTCGAISVLIIIIIDSKEEARLLKIFEELEQEDLLHMQNQIPEEVLDDEESDEESDEDYVEEELYHDIMMNKDSKFNYKVTRCQTTCKKCSICL
ncbi:hypothetical protein JTB14_038307 [Gonioctena quinquepunctata]|nr:hypothetical protein JTB14_038307 [Gonioctena quinquepunctata]